MSKVTRTGSKTTSRGNMYRAATATWSPFKGCGYDCAYCKPSFQRQAKRQMNNCAKCYTYIPHEHPNRLADSLPRTGFGQFIFTCSSGDIAFCGTPFLQQVADRCRVLADRTFLFQSKNPDTFNRIAWPRNVILGTTLETNRDALAQAVSKAPPPSQRVKDLIAVNHPTKMVTIEPVMDFDLPVMLGWIKAIAPTLVWLGYDSHATGLVEPPLDKFRQLHWELATRGYVVVLKTVRQARGLKASVPAASPSTAPSAPAPAAAPLSAASDWTPIQCEQWAGNAKPHVLAAIKVLASGGEPKTTEELNVASGSTSGGAIVGGLNAWATRNGLPGPLVKRKADGRSGYAFATDELRGMFEEVLRG